MFLSTYFVVIFSVLSVGVTFVYDVTLVTILSRGGNGLKTHFGYSLGKHSEYHFSRLIQVLHVHMHWRNRLVRLKL